MGTSRMCSSVHSAAVYIQHIPVRLTDITDIPVSDSLYMAQGALKGFQKLYTLFGGFSIGEECIGIDREGKLRVWVNGDASKNLPFYK